MVFIFAEREVCEVCVSLWRRCGEGGWERSAEKLIYKREREVGLVMLLNPSFSLGLIVIGLLFGPNM